MLLTLAFGNQQSVSWEISLTGGVHSRKVRGASRYTRENSGAQGTLEKSQGSLLVHSRKVKGATYTLEKSGKPAGTFEKSQGRLPVQSIKVRGARCTQSIRYRGDRHNHLRNFRGAWRASGESGAPGQPREIRGERDTRSGNFIDYYQLVSKEGEG